MPGLARLLLTLGVLLVVAGLIVAALTRFNPPLGRLPGDLSWRGRGWTISFPLATSLILSIILSLLVYLFTRSSR